MKLFAELRRRNVIRMAGLYLVGAWLLVQVAETLLPIFHTPEWVLQSMVVLLALGFVPALVFSWLYELTPDGLKRDAEVTTAQSNAAQTGQRMDRMIFIGLVALIAVVAADRFWPRQADVAGPTAASGAPVPAGSAGDLGAATARAAPGGPGASPASIPDPGSIAVLPFVNMSADRDNEYFSDGISEELLNVLVKIDGLSVASRTSSFAYKGRELSAATIGSELRVAHVLEGSVRKSGNRVRITAQLIDAGSDRHLWSETFDRELTDIFAIQDEIARAIVTALRGTLGERAPAAAAAVAAAVHADTDNLDAYQRYLKARELFITRTQLDESVRLFEQSVALDPAFARGWEGLAAASAVIVDWIATYPAIDREALLDRAEAASARALELDPTLSLPWAARALLEGYAPAPDYGKVIDHLGRAIAADPRNATAFLWRGINWITLGFLERALADFEHCLEIDPAYANCLRWKSLVLLFGGRADEALVLYEQGLARGFNDNRANSFIEPLVRRGNRFAAILLMRELGWPVEIQQAAVAAGEAPPDVAALLQRHPEARIWQYQLGLLLRDYPLAAAYETPSVSLVEHWDIAYEGLAASPAFKRILARLNVPTYWRQHEFPPRCRALGESDFECDQPEMTP